MNLLPGKIVGTGERTHVAIENGGTAVSNYPSRAEHMGKPGNVGIRPEDFVALDDESHIFEGTVDIVEALGEVTLLYFEAGKADPGDIEKGDAAVIAKLQGIHRGLRGQAVKLGADPAKVHVFLDGRSLLHA